MKKRVALGLIVLLILGLGAASVSSVSKWWQSRHQVSWREDKIVQGEIISVINSTGNVKPVMSVQVGSFVSGPIDDDVALAEFNQEVKKGDLLAKIDPRIYKAALLRDQASVKTREADVVRASALLKQAENDQARAEMLEAENADFVSDTEMDQVKFTRMSLAAQLEVAKASLDAAKANQQNSQANLDYTKIYAPVDGIIIDRKIEPGQTLTAQFQTPELFVLAPNMRDEMYIYASVDEADIGWIRDAQARGNPVEFVIDAYPNDTFEGKIKEVRFSSTTTQNVVTYPVIISAANPDLKLLPGMTTRISFQIEEKKDVLKISNAALRFYPLESQVREEDRKILEGASILSEDGDAVDRVLSAAEQAEAARKRKYRHVWVVEGEFLKAVEVEIGISDGKYSEVVSGDVSEGMKLVTGIKPGS